MRDGDVDQGPGLEPHQDGNVTWDEDSEAPSDLAHAPLQAHDVSSWATQAMRASTRSPSSDFSCMTNMISKISSSDSTTSTPLYCRNVVAAMAAVRLFPSMNT